MQWSKCRKSGVVWPKACAVNHRVINSLLVQPGIIAVFYLFSTLCVFYIYTYFFVCFVLAQQFLLHVCLCYLLSVLVTLQCKKPWRKSRKPSTGMSFLNITIAYTKYSYKLCIQNVKNTDCVTYHTIFFCFVFYLSVLCFRLQAESESWDVLLNKHRSKAEELQR